ncbi:MAG TPA: DUF2019 domain-containing protein [Stellaceae bacterium]|nr:DUF2019 domain-containing protein [Stellaceae bacterium]
MTGSELANLTDADLAKQFREYALEQQTALMDSNTNEYTRLYQKIERIDSELRARGLGARRSLLTLLQDENMRVRYEAACRCLGFAREPAVKALNEIVASHTMPEEGWAGMALENLASGRFKPT